MYAHMLTFDTYCTDWMCALIYSTTQICTHTHIHTSVFLAALFSLSSGGGTFIRLLFVQKDEGSRLFLLCRTRKGSNSNTVLPAAPCTR